MYGSYDGFLTYHTARGRDVSEWDETTVEGALLVSSEWIDSTFRSRFPGLKTGGQAQAAEWPRTGVIDYYGYGVASDMVPADIDRAAYEAALRVLRNREVLAPDAAPNKYRRVSIEGAISVEYAVSVDLQTQIPIIGQILSGLLWKSVGSDSPLSGRVVRA